MNNLLTESVCCGRISVLAKYVMSKWIYDADVEGTVGYSEDAWYSAKKGDL